MAESVGGQSRCIIRDGIDYVVRSETAHFGKCRVVAKHDPFWGEGKDYNGPVLDHPTWNMLFGQAGKAMRCTNDLHHCFFEGYMVKSVEIDPIHGKVSVIELFMGS
jgi:hypothetical protein